MLLRELRPGQVVRMQFDGHMNHEVFIGMVTAVEYSTTTIMMLCGKDVGRTESFCLQDRWDIQVIE